LKSYFTHFGELYRHLEKSPPKEDFLHHLESGRWEVLSKEYFLRTVRYLTLASYDNGWKGKQVAIAVSPSSYWLMLDYALMLSGAVSVPLFTNISSKNLLFEFVDSDIHTAFIESEEQEKLIHKVDKKVEVIYVGEDVSGYGTLEELLVHGQLIDKKNPTLFDELLERISPDDLATIVYTSGTSGTPKGVELTHRNLISQVQATALNYHFDREVDVAFSFLPLAHIFERMVMHFYLSRELSIYFSDEVKNVGVLLKEVNPTVMTVVPRLLEKVFFKMKLKAMDGNFIKKALVSLAFYRATTKDPFSKDSFLDGMLDKLVYKKLRAALGVRMRMLISGGAALSDVLYRFYLNIGIPLYQGYGQTESSPVIASNTPKDNKVGTCGKAFPGVEVQISDEGELLARGANVMRGYHNDVEATNEVIDSDGWLYTGDLAQIDDEGYISITGRKKELFKTSTGEYVSSVYIEQELVSNGWFEHALLVGDAKPYVVALLFVEHEFLGRFATQMKSTPRKALESEKFKMMTEKFIAQLNKKLNHWEKVRYFTVIADELSIEAGDLTPSMKLAKQHLLEQYSDEIDSMYKDHV
jgi:long-chain acyl-CoA synthetase